MLTSKGYLGLVVLTFLGASVLGKGLTSLDLQQEGSCAGRCNQTLSPGAPCQCNPPCVSFGDCCPDYTELCGGQLPITDAELSALSEELLALENANNVASLVKIDLQGKTQSGSTADLAPLPLLTVDPAAYNRSTVRLLRNLLDNYFPEVNRGEQVTDEERAEEQEFMTALFATPVIERLQEFLVAKKLPSGTQNFYDIWFGLYSRSGSTLGSSGFEHVFVGELNSGVSGFHNWLSFAYSEDNRTMNYRGWMKTMDIGTKGSLIENNFVWLGGNKPISSMFIGTSPELEMSLFTLCWYTRPGGNCKLTLNNKTLTIRTFVITNNGQKFVSTSYPDLSQSDYDTKSAADTM